MLEWSGESLEAEGTSQVILPGEGVKEDVVKDMDEAMAVIGTGPGPLICSYSSQIELWEPEGIFFVIQWTVKPEFGLNSFGGNI